MSDEPEVHIAAERLVQVIAEKAPEIVEDATEIAIALLERFPGIIAAVVDPDNITLKRRQWNDLMDANNRYQQEARDARAKIGGTTISEDHEALLKQSRVWLLLLIQLADVEPSDCDFIVRANGKDGVSRELMRVNLKTNVLDRYEHLYGPISKETLDLILNMADEIAGTTD